MNTNSIRANQPISPTPKKTTPTSSGLSDGKEILFLASGLITLVLGIGGVLMYSEEPDLSISAASEEASSPGFPLATAFASSSDTPSSIPSPSVNDEVLLTSFSEVISPERSSAQESPWLTPTDVYFDFNRWTLSEGAQNMLKTQIEGQGEEWSGSVRIDGHTDAQGTDSYNRALGLRRAKAVKTFLVSLGIPESTIQIQSFGKDGAVCEEHTPDCFEHNRRAHVVFMPEANVQPPDSLLSMAPDTAADSTPEAAAVTMDSPSIEVSEEAMLVQEENSGELVANDPLASGNSIP